MGIYKNLQFYASKEKPFQIIVRPCSLDESFPSEHIIIPTYMRQQPHQIQDYVQEQLSKLQHWRNTTSVQYGVTTYVVTTINGTCHIGMYDNQRNLQIESPKIIRMPEHEWLAIQPNLVPEHV